MTVVRNLCQQLLYTNLSLCSTQSCLKHLRLVWIRIQMSSISGAAQVTPLEAALLEEEALEVHPEEDLEGPEAICLFNNNQCLNTFLSLRHLLHQWGWPQCSLKLQHMLFRNSHQPCQWCSHRCSLQCTCHLRPKAGSQVVPQLGRPTIQATHQLRWATHLIQASQKVCPTSLLSSPHKSRFSPSSQPNLTQTQFSRQALRTTAVVLQQQVEAATISTT